MQALLPSVWQEPAAPNPPWRVCRDWALVVVLIPLSVLDGIFQPHLPARVLSTVVAVALVPTLLWRRTRPLLMVAIAFTACFALSVAIGADSQLDAFGYMLLLPYALFRWASGRAAVIGAAILLAKLGSSLLLGYLGPTQVFEGVAVLCAAAALGLAQRYRARSRLRELERAKLLERAQLARDLHDTVAHHVSAMAIRAQAGLAASAGNPDAATEALRVIEAEASRALAEMRAMVRVLRTEPALSPSPRVADIAALASPPRGGPAVEVELAGDLDDLPPSVGSALYRLAQESVTNARRHARNATRILVRVAADDTSVRLRVSDDGEVATRPSSPPGYGLTGMAERADLLGGVCEAGPDPQRGWTVNAVLPRRAPVSHPRAGVAA
ncbi:MAG: sensor histidine kinase [Micromonosporaceae bacterium]|nr:sensor histidine kinase [Micromonosporaceae bacterium]